MKLLKPSWVTHDADRPIFSIDIHPNGSRFATGGQGADSGRVVVWNLSSVLDENVEVDPNVPKMLCQMDNHLACVNCVRWSNNGKFLASGGDDKLVMIWSLSSSTGSAIFGSNGKLNSETWRCISTLRGHAGDVLDLAWSPLDKWLASCSVDNSIIIWNAEKLPEMVCVLRGHTGLVKGVAWDPVGKYLASQSDDKSLRVWKTADWTQESMVTEPFEECGGTTHVLRLSWSPDGQYVVSAHAMNGGGPTAQIVERVGWRCDKDFVGHRKAVTCTRFNSNILIKDGKKMSCAAVGSRDRSLSIWLTSLKRPLVVVHELFSDSVLDLSWSPDGLNLLACSWDGTIACIQFSHKEIGKPITFDEKNALYERIYGKNFALTSSNDANILVECPEILLAREKTADEAEKAKAAQTPKAKEPEKIVTPPKVEKPMDISPVAASSPLRPRDRQIETRTSDGKRRITPIFIPLHQSLNDSGSSVTENCFSSSSQNKSRIRVEKRDDIVLRPNVSNHASNTPREPDAPTNFAQANILNNQLDNRLKRKANIASLPGPTTEEVNKKRRLSTEAKQNAQTQSQSSNGLGMADFSCSSVLPTPQLGANGPVVRYAGKYRVQVLNNTVNTSYGKLSVLQILPVNTANSEPLWETYLSSAVTCVSCEGEWVCCGTKCGAFRAWRVHQQICSATPSIRLCAAAVRVCVRGARVCALTQLARLYTLDLAQLKAIRPPLDIRHLISTDVTVTNLQLNENGMPSVSLSNGKSFIYCDKLLTWITTNDSTDPLYRLSRSTTATTPLHTFTKGGYQAGAATSWLETQVLSSLHLENVKEYRHWIMALAQQLIQHGTEDRLRMLLDEMLGPAHTTISHSKWNSTVLGIPRHTLLKEILTLMVKDLRWQRLHTEYSDQLSAISVNGY